MKKIEALGRFELPKTKPRNQSLNDALRNSRSEQHELKSGAFQKRSRLDKHFKNAVNEMLDDEDDY